MVGPVLKLPLQPEASTVKSSVESSVELMVAMSRQSWCEWKGQAAYLDITIKGERIADAAWAYTSPIPNFGRIRNHLAFYPHLMDGCFVDDEKVEPQAGDFYGGWITSNIVGPFKGEPGTMGW